MGVNSGKVIGTYSADIIIEDEYDTQIAVDLLSKEIPGVNIDVDGSYLSLYMEQTGKYYSEPAVYYTSNGDGYPGSYEDDLYYSDEDDLRDHLSIILKGIPYEIDTVSVNIEYPEDYIDEDYYYDRWRDER